MHEAQLDYDFSLHESERSTPPERILWLTVLSTYIDDAIALHKKYSKRRKHAFYTARSEIFLSQVRTPWVRRLCYLAEIEPDALREAVEQALEGSRAAPLLH